MAADEPTRPRLDEPKTSGFDNKTPAPPVDDPPRHAATGPSAPAAGETVVVALKHPGGLILHYFQKQVQQEATRDGFRNVEVSVRVGEPFTLRGNAATAELERQALIPDQGGYALTHGVPKALWDQWYSHNKSSPLVTENLIAGFPNEFEALAWAKLHGTIRSGLERIDPLRPELTTGIRGSMNLSGIQPGVRPGA